MRRDKSKLSEIGEVLGTSVLVRADAKAKETTVKHRSEAGAKGKSGDKTGAKLKAEPQRQSKAHTKQVAKIKAKSSAVATAARPAKKRRKGRESWLLITGSDASRSSNVVLDEVQSSGFQSEPERIIFTQTLSDIVSRDVAIRVHAAKTLAGIRHPLSVRTLACQMTREPSPQVRQECIRSLTKLEMKKGLPVIAHALTDPAAPVRLAAVWGLYYLAKEDGSVVLLTMFSDEAEEVRRRAATCIGWLGQEEFAVKLLPLLDDSSPSVRRAAAEAMGNLGSRQVVWSLIEHLNDPDKAISKAILNALQAITGEKMSQSFPKDEKSLQRVTARWREWWKEELLVC
ncbi:MAG TPA: HEAT repeat domain-containing protein [Sedimentisphaerales bacterium]|nr:HEAT repeat domain-containing protein [Sedimentisphaerales bacterium]